ncbi:MAG TPA: hypothetical protein VN937_24815 [Blastocatellia bacterium]|nr:hypothetical protein [Blastocatellia bacterium]
MKPAKTIFGHYSYLAPGDDHDNNSQINNPDMVRIRRIREKALSAILAYERFINKADRMIKLVEEACKKNNGLPF